MKLLYSRNPNPRLAVAAARQVRAPVTFEFAAPLAPGQAERYRRLNPALRVPILVLDYGSSLWEADAIACLLSREAGSSFWRRGAAEPGMIQWISWGKENFVRACDTVQFQYVTKQRYGLGPVDPVEVANGLAEMGSGLFSGPRLALSEWPRLVQRRRDQVRERIFDLL